MSKLLEILGGGISVNPADLIWQWLNNIKPDSTTQIRYQELDKILNLLADMKLDEAIENLKFYLFETPDCVMGRMAAAAVYIHKNRIEDAIEELQSVYVRQPGNTTALYTIGYCYERLGREAEAIEFYQDCLKFKNFLKLPRERMAAIYLKNGRMEETIREYEQLIKEYPDDISALITLGYLYITDRQYAKAVNTFNSAILIHPDNFHFSDDTAELDTLIKTGRHFEALESIQAQIDRNGEQPDLLVKLADIYSAADQTPEAMVNYEKALKIQPNYLEATIKLGTLHLRTGRSILAAEQFNRAVEINDQIVDAYIGLSYAQLLDNQPEEALSMLSLASAVHANSTLLFAQTAVLQLTPAETSPHISYLDNATLLKNAVLAHETHLSGNPRNQDTHYRYGMLQLASGQAQKAIRAFREVLKLNPHHYRAAEKLAMCLYETDNHKEAVEQFEYLNNINLNQLQLHYKIALLYCDRTRFAHAIRNTNEKFRVNCADAALESGIATVLQNLGIYDISTTTWEGLSETAMLSGPDADSNQQ